MDERRQDVKIALLRIHARQRDQVIQDFARLLKIIRGLGYTHATRELIGGGTEIKICDPKKGFTVAEVINRDGKVYVCFPTEEWFDNPDFQFPDSSERELPFFLLTLGQSDSIMNP